MRTCFAFALVWAAPALSGVVDRVAVTVGNDVITETEIVQEIRITGFINQEDSDLTPEGRREAAERLVDQSLVRREMNIGYYPEPENSEAARMLSGLRKTHFSGDDGAYRASLKRYGITEAQLKEHLLWELTALRFTDVRFRPDIPQPTQALRSSADRQAGERAAPQPSPTPSGSASRAAPGNVDQQLEDWLRDARSRTRIVYFKEAFE